MLEIVSHFVDRFVLAFDMLFLISFLDNKRVEHARHHFFPLPGQSVEWESGEFLCPLCQCYSNTVLPLVPQVGQLSVGTELAEPIVAVTMLEWKKLLLLAVELASGDSMDTGKCMCVCVIQVKPPRGAQLAE